MTPILHTVPGQLADPVLDMAPPSTAVAPPPTGIPAVDQALQVAMAVASVVTTLIVVFGPVLRLLWPVFAGAIRNAKLRHAVESISLAMKPAASAAYAAEQAAMEAARAPTSPGGTAVTDEERQRARATGVAVGLDILKRNGSLAQAIEMLGEETVNNSFRTGIDAKRAEHPDARDP